MTTTYVNDGGNVTIANGDHLFWFPKMDSTLGRCRKCKLIVTRKEAENRKFGTCVTQEANQ